MSGKVRQGTGRSRRCVVALGVVLIFAVALFGSVLAACGDDGDDGSTAATADAGILRVASWLQVTSWDPREAAADEPMFLANI
jgi:hypothetical protein